MATVICINFTNEYINTILRYINIEKKVMQTRNNDQRWRTR